MGKTMEVAALVVVVVKEGGERGKNRDAPDWHEGLRLLAALRQLGGVRRGIEIANAHYGYFPIEGRIPLSLSLPLHRLLPRFSLFLIPFSPPPRRTAHARDLSPSRLRVREKRLPFTSSLYRSLHASAPRPSLSLFLFLATLLPHIVFRSISPHLCLLSYHSVTSFFLPRALSRFLRLSFSFLLGTPRDLAHFSFSSCFRTAETYARKRAHTVALSSQCAIPSYL